MFGAIAGHGLAQLVEPPRAVEQRLDEEQAPAVADPIERGFEGRLGVAGEARAWLRCVWRPS